MEIDCVSPSFQLMPASGSGMGLGIAQHSGSFTMPIAQVHHPFGVQPVATRGMHFNSSGAGAGSGGFSCFKLKRGNTGLSSSDESDFDSSLGSASQHSPKRRRTFLASPSSEETSNPDRDARVEHNLDNSSDDMDVNEVEMGFHPSGDTSSGTSISCATTSSASSASYSSSRYDHEDDDFCIDVNQALPFGNLSPTRPVMCKRCKESFVPGVRAPHACRFHSHSYTQEARDCWDQEAPPSAAYSLSVSSTQQQQQQYFWHVPTSQQQQKFPEGGRTIRVESFWPCCGQKDPNAPGCKASCHIAFGEDDPYCDY